MIGQLTPCRACGEHRFAGPAGCPHCGASPSNAPTPAAALLGLALLGGCADDGGGKDTGPTTTPMPTYGVTIIETGDTGDTGCPTTGTTTDCG